MRSTTDQGGETNAIRVEAHLSPRRGHSAISHTADVGIEAYPARVLGRDEGSVTVMIHCGSRGLGHQVCTDHLLVMDATVGRFGIELPDRDGTELGRPWQLEPKLRSIARPRRARHTNSGPYRPE